MSIALMGAGVNMGVCPKRKCWYGHLNHVIAAEELAKWLEQPNILGDPIKKKGNTLTKGGKPYLFGAAGVGLNLATAWVKDKNGIVFFKDFYPPDGLATTPFTGDHIDVWDGDKMSGERYHGESGEYIDPVVYMANKLNYFNRAPQIWFWEITQ